MKYSVRIRVSGGEIGSHDTLWDEAKIDPMTGWLKCRNIADYPGAGFDPERTTDERWYPPTSVYSVKPIR